MNACQLLVIVKHNKNSVGNHHQDNNDNKKDSDDNPLNMLNKVIYTKSSIAYIKARLNN